MRTVWTKINELWFRASGATWGALAGPCLKKCGVAVAVALESRYRDHIKRLVVVFCFLFFFFSVALAGIFKRNIPHAKK